MSNITTPIWQDPWPHIAGLIAIGIGFAGWYTTGLAHDPSSVELMFMIGGLAGLGIKIINGSAAQLAANTAAQVVSLATKTATATTQAAATEAAGVLATAVKTAAPLEVVVPSVVPPAGPHIS
jgi:hypothetical protein